MSAYLPMPFPIHDEDSDDEGVHDTLVPWYSPPERVWFLLNGNFLTPEKHDQCAEYARRPLVLVSSDDGIVLFDTPDTRDFVSYTIMALRAPINPDNIIWAKFDEVGYDVEKATLFLLDKIAKVAPKAGVVLRNPNSTQFDLCKERGLHLLNDLSLPNKEWLHKKDRGYQHYIELKDPKTGKMVRVAKPMGKVVSSKAKLIPAFRELKQRLGPEGKIVAKLSNITAGKGVFLDTSEEDIADLNPSKKNPVVLEEQLRCTHIPVAGFERYENSPAVHCIGREIYGSVCSQLMDGKFFNGVVAPPLGIDMKTQTYCKAVCRALARQFKFEATWGVDFLVTDDGTPYLVDLNFGRLNNTHFSKMFLDLHDLLGQNFRSFKRAVPFFPNGLNSLWAMMASLNLGFSAELSRGVAILAFENGVRASFVATAATSEELFVLEQEIDKVIKHARAHVSKGKKAEKAEAEAADASAASAASAADSGKGRIASAIAAVDESEQN